jgi:nitrate reductase gamma subunit
MPEAVLVQPDIAFIEDVFASGGGEFKKCQQCAACVSTCSLSNGDNGFPRRQMLMAQWGLKDQLLADPGPWLCFYCGDCSKTCTRQANPGETMMALRRYQTSAYDWTGLSRRMYRSAFWEIGILLLVALVVVLLFTVPSNFGFGLLNSSGPEPLNTVMLDRFAPKHVVHLGDAVMAFLLSAFLLSNAARMFSGMTRGSKIPMGTYLKQLPNVVVQGMTQKRWKDCKDPEAVANWRRHLFLVTGYATMFLLVVPFLPWFQREDTSFHWTSFLGYYATIALLFTTVTILFDRIRKRTEMHRFSHLSDWLFPILLLLTAITGIVGHAFRMMNLPMATYVTYMVHLAIAVPMLVVEVPFGKWSHLLYRPLAMWIAAVREEAAKQQGAA